MPKLIGKVADIIHDEEGVGRLTLEEQEKIEAINAMRSTVHTHVVIRVAAIIISATWVIFAGINIYLKLRGNL